MTLQAHMLNLLRDEHSDFYLKKHQDSLSLSLPPPPPPQSSQEVELQTEAYGKQIIVLLICLGYDHPGVTLCGWQDVKIQDLIPSNGFSICRTGRTYIIMEDYYGGFMTLCFNRHRDLGGWPVVKINDVYTMTVTMEATCWPLFTEGRTSPKPSTALPIALPVLSCVSYCVCVLM